MVSRLIFSLVVAAALLALPQSVRGQKTLLQIKPHVGDTIRMHLTQTIEMTGSRSRAPGDSVKTMIASTEVFSRAVPFQWTTGGTLIHAITDSVISGTRSSTARLPEIPRKRAVSPAVLRVAADGAIEVVDDGDPNSEIRHLFAEVPSMLPGKAVGVGERWTKEMRIPLAGDPGAEGTVKATLQLDSLSRSGEMAFISIHGTISRFTDASRHAPPNGYQTSGTFTGSMQIDRALGWITDAKSIIIVRSEIADAAAAPAGRPTRPVQVLTRISVWTRAMKVR